jgi:hypothetical protein
MRSNTATIKSSFAFILILSFFSPLACAEAPLELVKKVISEKSVPMWKKRAQDAIALNTNPSDKLWKEIWNSLDNTEKTVSSGAALQNATSPRSQNELGASLEWLRWKILTQGADGRYSYAYSYLLGNLKDSKGDLSTEAAIFLNHARLSLAIENSRCEDKTSSRSIIDGYELQPDFQPILKNTANLPANAKAVSWLEAVAIEEMVGERPVFERMCSMGSKAMLSAISKESNIKKTKDKDYIGGSVNKVDTSKEKVERLPAAEWRKLRREILDKKTAEAAKAL